MKLIVLTQEGTATIDAKAAWTESTDLQVTGKGAGIAREWLETAYGPFGHFVGQHAAPLDLHFAALELKAHPLPQVQVLGFHAEEGTYDSTVPEGSIT